MDKVTGSKWQLRLAAFLIFLLGIAAGILAPKAYHMWFDAPARSRQDRFQQMLDRLQLDEAQKTQVQQILGDARGQLNAIRRESEPRVEEVRRNTDERLQKVLTPEQWQRWQQLKNEMDRRGRRGRGGRGGGGGPRTTDAH
jgi:Spy/CpxP family protein refolding chaperone